MLQINVNNPRIPGYVYGTNIPWDPSLTSWEQFERYYFMVPRVLRTFERNWREASVEVRERAVMLLEDQLLKDVSSYDTTRVHGVEPFLYKDLWGDLYTFWVREGKRKTTSSGLNEYEGRPNEWSDDTADDAINMSILTSDVLSPIERLAVHLVYVERRSRIEALQWIEERLSVRHSEVEFRRILASAIEKLHGLHVIAEP